MQAKTVQTLKSLATKQQIKQVKITIKAKANFCFLKLNVNWYNKNLSQKFLHENYKNDLKTAPIKTQRETSNTKNIF